jgi:hypothetical protein
MVDSFIGGGNRSAQSDLTDLPQVTDKLYRISLYEGARPVHDLGHAQHVA